MTTTTKNTDKVEVRLQYPFTFAGREVEVLNMRRPKVKDLRLSSRYGEKADEQEIGLLSVLIGCTPEDLDEMDAADYGSLQETFRKMVKPTAEPVAIDGGIGGEVQDATVGD